MRWMVRRSGRAPYCGSKPFVDQEILRSLRDNQFDLLLGQLHAHAIEQQFDDRVHLFDAQRVEDDDLIDTVQELRLEGVLQFAEHLALHRLILALIGFGLVLRLFEADRGFFVQQGLRQRWRS